MTTNNPTTPIAWGIQLARLWIASGQGFPVRVRDIALEVTKQRFPDEPIGLVMPHGVNGIDGMLTKRKKKQDWVISYDENVTLPGRINFTLAHEFGHYLLHRQLRDEFRCAQSEMMDYDSPESQKIEAQANLFASYLLMPRNDFEEQIRLRDISFELFGECADRYKTSLTATILKWLEFTEEAAMLVVADHDEFILWSFCSQSARRIRAYKAPGEMLPAAVIARLQSAEGNLRESVRVGPGEWHISEEAIESVVISDQFGQFIFLIRFPYAGSPEHEEETDTDSFDTLSERAAGLGWKK